MRSLRLVFSLENEIKVDIVKALFQGESSDLLYLEALLDKQKRHFGQKTNIICTNL